MKKKAAPVVDVELIDHAVEYALSGVVPGEDIIENTTRLEKRLGAIGIDEDDQETRQEHRLDVFAAVVTRLVEISQPNHDTLEAKARYLAPGRATMRKPGKEPAIIARCGQRLDLIQRSLGVSLGRDQQLTDTNQVATLSPVEAKLKPDHTRDAILGLFYDHIINNNSPPTSYDSFANQLLLDLRNLPPGDRLLLFDQTAAFIREVHRDQWGPKLERDQAHRSRALRNTLRDPRLETNQLRVRLDTERPTTSDDAAKQRLIDIGGKIRAQAT